MNFSLNVNEKKITEKKDTGYFEFDRNQNKIQISYQISVVILSFHSNCDMMQSARLSEKAMLREAVEGVIAKGSHRDPIVVACHALHVENYAAMVRRRFEGGGLVTAKFVMRADDVQPVEVIKEYEDAEKGEVLACFEALTSLRSLALLMSKD